MRKENNVEKTLLNIVTKNCFVPKVGLGSCFRRNDKLRKLKYVYYVEMTLLKARHA
jgi:hypothetical protein